VAPEPAYDVTRSVVGLARTLRAAGVPASPGRVQAMVAALEWLDPALRRDVYWAGRLTLCGSSDDIAGYNRVFEAYFGDRVFDLRTEPTPTATQLRLLVLHENAGADGDEAWDEAGPVSAAASATERLRHRDIAGLSDEERTQLARLLAAFALPGERRVTRRAAAAPRGRVDRRRTLLRMMRAGGEPTELAHRRRRSRPRRVVLLIDVSGSMSSYTDALLRFAHAASRRRGTPTEVFTLGTRLTRVTSEMAHRDPEGALRAVSSAVPDWSGGTTLGTLLKQFLDEWGQPGLARGAIAVVLSDGWERGDALLLGEQMARLHRLAHRLLWANPRAGRDGYAPLAAGMAAALPHVDAFVSGHSLSALEHLAAMITGTRVGEVARA
jgi:uncharacterized protein with von Willebrand factor type A (vWA) domain